MSKTDTEAIEVEAVPVEDGLGTLSKADRWLEATRQTVAEKAAEYVVPEVIKDERGYKGVKAARAACRRDVAELDAQRKAMTRKVEDFLKSFRAEVKDVLGPLTELDGQYAALISEYEGLWTDERRAQLSEYYEGYAPDLVPLVPFSVLLERYGSERGKGWLLRSVKLEAAIEALEKCVGEIADGERVLDGLDMDEEERQAAKADYFRTLDMQRTLNAARERREQRGRVAQLEAERAERERQAAEAMAQAEAAQMEIAEEPKPEPAPEPEAKPKLYGSMVTPEEYAELCGQLGETPVPVPEPPQPVARPQQVAPGFATFVFAGYGTEAQANQFKQWCGGVGVTRHVEQPTNGKSFVLRAVA